MSSPAATRLPHPPSTPSPSASTADDQSDAPPSGPARRIAAAALGVLVLLVLVSRWLGGADPMPPAPVLAADVAGTYRLDDGAVITLWGPQPHPSYEHDGLVTQLVADGPDRYRNVGGGGGLEVVRAAEGSVTGLRITTANQPPREAAREHLHDDLAVTFTNRDVELAATLLLPEGPGPHPAVVIVHGAEPARRHTYQLLASHFARRGVAALIYDKRGVGESTGEVANASFDDLTGDALAGIDLLASRPEIDPERIGALGWSQGAWIVATAAQASDELAFVIAFSPSGFAPADQQAWLHGSMLAARGFDQPAMTIADRVSRMAYSSLDLVDAGLLPRTPHVPGFWFHALDPYLNTAELWENLDRPVLAVWGEFDCQVPAHNSARLLGNALEAGGNRDATFVILPDADHSLALTIPCGHETGLGSHNTMHYAHGALGLAADWILDSDVVPSTDVEPAPRHEDDVLGWHLDPPAPAPWYGTLAAQVVVIVVLLSTFAVVGVPWAFRVTTGLLRRRPLRRARHQHLVGATALAGFATTVAGLAAIVEIAMLGDTHAAFLFGGPTVLGASTLLTAGRTLATVSIALGIGTALALTRARALSRHSSVLGAALILLAAWASYWQLLPAM